MMSSNFPIREQIVEIDHIAVAVESIDRARPFFEKVIGAILLWDEEVPSQYYRWAYFSVGGLSRWEMIQPLRDTGFVKKFLEKRGPGLHHVTIRVRDLKAVVKILRESGVEPIGINLTDPKWMEAFVHPKDALGVLVQFAQFEDDLIDWMPDWMKAPPAGPSSLLARVRASHRSFTNIYLQKLGGKEKIELMQEGEVGQCRISTRHVSFDLECINALMGELGRVAEELKK